MYTLRTVMPNHTENILLGNSYVTITAHENREQFDLIVKDNGYNPDNVFAIVHSDQNNQSITLLKEYKYYIMLEGKTISNISFK